MHKIEIKTEQNVDLQGFAYGVPDSPSDGGRVRDDYIDFRGPE